MSVMSRYSGGVTIMKTKNAPDRLVAAFTTAEHDDDAQIEEVETLSDEELANLAEEEKAAEAQEELEAADVSDDEPDDEPEDEGDSEE